jgi:hypothetical protein
LQFLEGKGGRDRQTSRWTMSVLLSMPAIVSLTHSGGVTVSRTYSVPPTLAAGAGFLVAPGVRVSSSVNLTGCTKRGPACGGGCRMVGKASGFLTSVPSRSRKACTRVRWLAVAIALVPLVVAVVAEVRSAAGGALDDPFHRQGSQGICRNM